MKPRVLLLASCLAMVSAVASAQTEKDAEKAFSDSIMKHRLIPIGLSADPLVFYRWEDNGLSIDQPKAHTLGVFVADSVKLKNGKLQIDGKRTTLIKDDTGKFALSGGSPVKLVIDLSGADPVTALPELKQRLFYASAEEAMANIPLAYQRYLPYAPKAKPLPGTKPEPMIGTSPNACNAEGSTDKIKRPKPVHIVDLELSDEARAGHISGTVVLAMTIGLDGRPTDLWVAKATGSGLDESAVRTTSQSTFKPATCKGIPIAVTMQMDVSYAFQ